MKHLFKEGKFRDIDGNIVILFENGFDTSADEFFDKSLWEISSTLGLYDFDQFENTKYYYIYRKYGKNVIKYTSEQIDTSIRKILSGDFEDVISDNFSLGIPDESLENDIFWDVNNDIIVVKGKENLKQMCIELVMHDYERLGIKRNPETDQQLLNNMFDAVPMLPKVYELCENQDMALTKSNN